jgi:hypothetical protein
MEVLGDTCTGYAPQIHPEVEAVWPIGLLDDRN